VLLRLLSALLAFSCWVLVLALVLLDVVSVLQGKATEHSASLLAAHWLPAALAFTALTHVLRSRGTAGVRESGGWGWQARSED